MVYATGFPDRAFQALSNICRLAVLIAFSVAITLASAGVKTATDGQTQLQSWTLVEGALSLQIIQRLPDQTRAFFQGRGFSSNIANDIATLCVLQTIGKNTASSSDGDLISYDLHDWKVRYRGAPQSIKFKELWDQEWSKHDVSTASRLAFRWATFPTQQSFEAGGDFNWGMISFGLKPGSVFDLKVIWQQNNQTRSQWINQIKCPSDH